MSKLYENLRLIEEPNPILHIKCRPISQITEDIIRLSESMFNLMYQHQGVGLSAPQVGILKKIFVMDSAEKGSEPLTLVNPKIIKYIGEEKPLFEGCLSFPGLLGYVARHDDLVVKFINLQGVHIKRRFKGLDAQIVQHEIDHLDGITFDKSIINANSSPRTELHNYI